jgi:15-cis-phytoene synthase
MNQHPVPQPFIARQPSLHLQSSQRYCRRLSRRSRSSFRFAFGLLPTAQADAMHALYAFLRVTDDLTDEPGDDSTKRQSLERWRVRLEQALAGTATHRCHPAIAHTLNAYDIPADYLLAVLDGCETDLVPVQIQSFDELRVYCYRVASAVGLACVRIWGVRPGIRFEEAAPLAEDAGYAFQLTNILRDLGEDWSRGRVYLPADELTRFECPAQHWGEPTYRGRFEELLRFQVARAEEYYRRSEPLAEMLCPKGRTVFTLMCQAYRTLLKRVSRAGPAVLDRRVRLPWWKKANLAGRAWVHTWIG